MVDRELLKNILEKIQMTGDLPTGDEGATVIEAAKAYLEMPDPNLIKLLNDLGETRAILMRNAQQNSGKDGEILQKMFETVTAATDVIQAAMVRAQS